MKIELSTDNSFPSKKLYFWQLIIIPSISILRMKADVSESVESYIVLTFDWLFWGIAISIK
jgi:hypothetical protein